MSQKIPFAGKVHRDYSFPLETFRSLKNSLNSKRNGIWIF